MKPKPLIRAIKLLKKLIYNYLSADRREALFYYVNVLRDLPEILRFKRKLKHYPPVIILQMGKVGSKSVYETLKAIYPGAVIHCHGLTEKPRANWKSTLVYRAYKRKGIQVKVITPVRDKLARSLSSFFYNAPVHDGISYDDLNAMPLKQIIGHFMARRHRSYTFWLEKNYLQALGIDIFQHVFDKEKGFMQCSSKQADCLFFQSELDDDVKSALIREFLELEGFYLKHRSNKSTEYSYKYSYERFMEKAALPESFLQELMNDPGFCFFYSKHHRDRVLAQWIEA